MRRTGRSNVVTVGSRCAGIGAEQIRKPLQSFGNDSVIHRRATSFTGKQPRGLEGLQVMRNGGLRHCDTSRKVAHAYLPVAVAGHHAEQLQPHRIRQRLERTGQLAGRLRGDRFTHQRCTFAGRDIGPCSPRFRHGSILTVIKSGRQPTRCELWAAKGPPGGRPSMSQRLCARPRSRLSLRESRPTGDHRAVAPATRCCTLVAGECGGFGGADDRAVHSVDDLVGESD
jgi:hypothetical protein